MALKRLWLYVFLGKRAPLLIRSLTFYRSLVLVASMRIPEFRQFFSPLFLGSARKHIIIPEEKLKPTLLILTKYRKH